MASKAGVKTTGRGKSAPPEVGRSRPATKTVRLGDDLTDKLQELADERDMSFSALIRVAAEKYLEKEAFEVALGEMEASMAATLNAARRDTVKVSDDVQLLVAILDQFVKFSMMAAPDVHDKEGAVALGNKRYEGFIATLHKSFRSRRKKAVLTETLESMETEAQYG